MGTATSVATKPQVSAPIEVSKEVCDSADLFTESEVNHMLSAVSSGIPDDDDRQEFTELNGDYKRSLMVHFCGSRSAKGALIAKSTVFNMTPWIIECYLEDKVGVIYPLHRQLMSRYITQQGTRQRNAQELKHAKANAPVVGVTDVSGRGCDEDSDEGQSMSPSVMMGGKGRGAQGRTTQRFITKIDKIMKRITCIRRVVSSDDFAISHRWAERPINSQWTVVSHAHSESCWEDAACNFLDYDSCAMRGDNVFCNIVLKEWTVECSCEEDMGGRKMLYPEVSYKCSLTAEEADNLNALLTSHNSGGLWCDFVCINQADPYDKMEQLPLMGSLFVTATTLVVGPSFARRLPPDDYLFRAWCHSESEHGSILCDWDFDTAGVVDKISLRTFVFEVLKGIPIVVGGRVVKVDLGKHHTHGANLAAVFEFVRSFNFEHEPINDMTEDKILSLAAVLRQVFEKDLPAIYLDVQKQLAEISKELIAAIQEKEYDEDSMIISRCFLRAREAISSCLDVDPVACQYRVFESQAALREDRLYAVWGAPMWLRQQQRLPYPDHSSALRLIFKSFPTAEFALYRREQKYVQFSYFTEVEDLLLNFLTGDQRPAKEYVCKYYDFAVGEDDASAMSSSAASPVIVVAVNERCIGVGLKEKAEMDNCHTAMWVVFNKNVLKYVLDSDVDQFCRYCFLYMLYEVGLFNDYNLNQRQKLFKFCRKLAR
mmetsp:Transcript_18334/g.34275  ORF Transcript_18334/g.34275 Transcript_18334/m.34275 type:complete len:712 (-) Transcript_18334:33-2168(-)